MAKDSTTLKGATSRSSISFTVQVWRENGTCVAYAPGLDVSSCGESVREAKARLREAVSLFLEEAASRGTLEDILAESGFERRGRAYRSHRVLSREKVRLAVPAGS